VGLQGREERQLDQAEKERHDHVIRNDASLESWIEVNDLMEAARGGG
jgi:hypothetical protein